MKNKDLKKYINSLVETTEVSPLDPSFLQRINYEPNETPKKLFNFAFLKVALISFACILIGVFVVIMIDRGTTITPPVNLTEVTISKTKKQLAYQTIGCYGLIESMTSNGSLLLSNNNNEQIKKDIEKYLTLTNSYLDLSHIELTLYENSETGYKYEYHFKLNEEEVILYFNETSEKDYDDIDEVSSKIEGILYMNEKEYRVLGQKEVEEAEVETSLKVYVDTNFYIEVNQEIELGENEYEFMYYQNNKKIQDFSIEIENGASSTFVEIEEKNLNGQIDNSFEFELKNNIIYCEFETKNYEGNVVIRYINGKYEYTFE